jgi:hypothetical protein
MQVLNFDLLKHPMNWLTILLMLIIAGIAGHLLLSYVGSNHVAEQKSVTA